MGHQAANRTALNEIAGHAAQNPFANLAVPISAGHKQIRSRILRGLNELVCARALFGINDLCIGAETMARQEANDVVDACLCLRFLT